MVALAEPPDGVADVPEIDGVPDREKDGVSDGLASERVSLGLGLSDAAECEAVVSVPEAVADGGERDVVIVGVPSVGVSLLLCEDVPVKVVLPDVSETDAVASESDRDEGVSERVGVAWAVTEFVDVSSFDLDFVKCGFRTSVIERSTLLLGLSRRERVRVIVRVGGGVLVAVLDCSAV